MNQILIYFAIKYKGDWDKIFKALEDKERVSLKDIQAQEKALKEHKIITILDNNYPKQLKAAYKPPFVVWLEGDEKLLNNHILAITGEKVDSITEERIRDFTPEVEKGQVILQPGFEGVDEKIAETSSKGKIYVLSSGTDVKQKKFKTTEKDLLITEYPLGVKSNKKRENNRNRIIASVSDSLVLYSSAKSGKMNSIINSFLNQGKEIYCFPGDGKENDGNSELIKQGANLITSIRDVGDYERAR